ncbi:AraC-type DNA-binding protein [Dyadobacter koreensis]|uniref:AraC-type DNA-binding protein n=1 Tax=Dyadobacter koreensis TaxID=408657 RepID=A0A1H6VF11_9BACT|nr:helix-turn-helix domain-containing protein [Dyadobacter koreensis]SEJ01564.1 AraC-type DNA-binding protein [Dyadobacter koreensis]
MKYKSTGVRAGENGLVKTNEFPLHDMGEDFFAMTTIEGGEDHFFNGIHRHDFYEVLWFSNVKSEQAHYIDFVKYPIAENQVFLLLPDQVHNMDKRGKTGFLFALSKDFFERLIASDIFKLFYHSTNFTVVIPEEQLKLFHTLKDLIQTEHEAGKRPAILESYIRSWFLHCIELKRKEANDRIPDSRLRILIESVEVNFKVERKASFYAHELSLSPKRLNELTKNSFGKTITQIINERLILEAKREISCCEKPIKEISYELGFSEPSYFTRFFGKQTGYTPEDFRRKMGTMYN